SIVGFQMRTFMEPSPTTDASGVARIERLPAGTYRVVVGEAVTTVTVTEGGETDTALQLP
ncbi:MAG: prealbumin-like fold domain-containing protein, partial [Acidobacteriota bacterium]|nr:prealbumin-like fold domain-containing protein [Acidobacteriota bacterium]